MNQVTLPILLTTTLLLISPLSSTARVSETVKSGPEINEISQRTTLLIIGFNNNRDPIGHGSGSLIAKDGDVCVGLTNAHVINIPDTDFIVRTSDEAVHQVTDVRAFVNEDLAVVTFTCQEDYQPITIATYQLSPGQTVYLSSWPGDGNPTGGLTRQFTSGTISTLLDRPIDGYQVGYTLVHQWGRHLCSGNGGRPVRPTAPGTGYNGGSIA